MKLALYYIIAVNIVAFAMFGIDKHRARYGQRRIPEVTLLLMAALGGSFGAWLGMMVWHHKTQHNKFRYGIPALILLQFVLIICLLARFSQVPMPI